MYQTDPPRPAKEFLPTMYDLPSENPEEPGLPDQFHLWQPRLLEETFTPPNYPVDEIFVASESKCNVMRWQFYSIQWCYNTIKPVTSCFLTQLQEP